MCGGGTNRDNLKTTPDRMHRRDPLNAGLFGGQPLKTRGVIHG